MPTSWPMEFENCFDLLPTSPRTRQFHFGPFRKTFRDLENRTRLNLRCRMRAIRRLFLLGEYLGELLRGASRKPRTNRSTQRDAKRMMIHGVHDATKAEGDRVAIPNRGVDTLSDDWIAATAALDQFHQVFRGRQERPRVVQAPLPLRTGDASHRLRSSQ